MTESAHQNMITLTDPAQDQPAEGSPFPESELVITHDPSTGLYEGTVDGRSAGGIVYSRTGDHVTLLATSVLPDFRGQGIAGRLLGGVLSELRDDTDHVTVTCPFATAYIKTHPEFADLIHP